MPTRVSSAAMNAPSQHSVRTVAVEPDTPQHDLPHHQRLRLQRMRRIARVLDTALRIPGTGIRVGADSIVGLIPGAGDLITSAFAAYLIVEAAKLGVPRRILLKMLANMGIDLAVGAVPVLGDVFDVAFKANQRNMRVLERHLANTAHAKQHTPR